VIYSEVSIFRLAIKWRVMIAIVPLFFALTACATGQNKKQYLQMISMPHVSAPLVLKAWKATPFALTQLVEGDFQGTRYQAHFEIEWRKQTLTIVGLSLAGLPLFKIQASEKGTDHRSLIPEAESKTAMDPAWVLSDFLLTIAPMQLLQSGLSSPDLQAISNVAQERTLQRQGKTAVSITYSQSGVFAPQIAFKNLELGYDLSIKNIQFEELKP